MFNVATPSCSPSKTVPTPYVWAERQCSSMSACFYPPEHRLHTSSDNVRFIEKSYYSVNNVVGVDTKERATGVFFQISPNGQCSCGPMTLADCPTKQYDKVATATTRLQRAASTVQWWPWRRHSRPLSDNNTQRQLPLCWVNTAVCDITYRLVQRPLVVSVRPRMKADRGRRSSSVSALLSFWVAFSSFVTR